MSEQDVSTAPEQYQYQSVIDDELLGEHDIYWLKCKTCTGYGCCAYKSFAMYNDKPIIVCGVRLQELLEQTKRNT